MNEEILNKIMQHLEDLNKRISSIEKNLSTEKSGILLTERPKEESRRESFMEFFRKYSPDKATDKTLIIMYFLELVRDVVNITTKDISSGFKEVREKVPANVADKIQMLHKKGLIMPGDNVDNLRGWLITRTGLDYLKELESGNRRN